MDTSVNAVRASVPYNLARAESILNGTDPAVRCMQVAIIQLSSAMQKPAEPRLLPATPERGFVELLPVETTTGEGLLDAAQLQYFQNHITSRGPVRSSAANAPSNARIVTTLGQIDLYQTIQREIRQRLEESNAQDESKGNAP